MLTSEDKRRYARHLLLKEIGETGQQRLSQARVLVIGAGGLGAAALSYLAAAGIGTLGIADDDTVELSNLARQIIHEQGDIGRRKVESAADRIGELNPHIAVHMHRLRLTPDNAGALVASYDLIVDGTDNFDARFALNMVCHTQHKPWVHAAVRGWNAQLTMFSSYLGSPHPCYRCLVPSAPPGRNDCAERGVIGPLVGILGSMQALEAIKALTGAGQPLSGRLLRYDGLKGNWRESRLPPDPSCPVCGAT